MPIIAVVVGLVVLGLLITYWYVGLPLLVIAAVVGAVYLVRDRRSLARLPEADQVVERERRQVAREERRERWEASAQRAREEKLERQEQALKRRVAAGKADTMPLTQVAGRSESGQPACPRCGGVQFVPRRKTSTKVMFGVASLAGRPHHVECVTCGAMYARG